VNKRRFSLITTCGGLLAAVRTASAQAIAQSVPVRAERVIE